MTGEMEENILLLFFFFFDQRSLNLNIFIAISLQISHNPFEFDHKTAVLQQQRLRTPDL